MITSYTLGVPMSVEGYVPLEFRNILIYPRRKLLGVSIYLKDNRPENLAKLGKMFYEHKLFPDYVYSSIEPHRSAKMIIVLDLTDRNADVNVKSILREIREVDIVDHIKMFDPTTEGFIVDTTSFPLTMFGKRIFMLREPAFREAILTLVRNIGPMLTTKLLHQIGTSIGREYGNVFKEIAGNLSIEDPIEIINYIAAPILQSLSYAVLDVETRDNEIIVKKRDCIECLAVKEIMEENPNLDMRGYSPRCNMVRGLIEGSISVILGREFKSEETQCIAEGSDHCEVILRPKWK